MANNLFIKDANGVSREVKTEEAGGVHTPVQHALGPVTNTELRASPIGVTGPVTDVQLRASPVPVIGPLTDAQMRATAVKVSIDPNALPVPVSIGTGVVVPVADPLVLPLSVGHLTVTGTMAALTPPALAIGVRLTLDAGAGGVVFYNFGAAVGTPFPPTGSAFINGGVIYLSSRELFWTPGTSPQLFLTCAASVGLWVEWLKRG